MRSSYRIRASNLVLAFACAVASASLGAASARAQPARGATASRWVHLRVDDRPVIAYTYRDRMAGPSARGEHVGNPPTAEEIRAVVERPSVIVRNPADYGARPLGAREIRRLHLPAAPPWIGIYEGPPASSTPPGAAAGGAVVEGRVTRAGSPAVASVLLAPSSGPTRSAFADAAGAFRFEGVAPGRYYVFAENVGERDVTGAWARSEIDVGSSTAHVDLQLPVGRRLDLLVEGVSLRSGDHPTVTLQPGDARVTTSAELHASIRLATLRARVPRTLRDSGTGVAASFGDVAPGAYQVCTELSPDRPLRCHPIRVTPGVGPQSVRVPASR